jgi:hypothetical protein
MWHLMAAAVDYTTGTQHAAYPAFDASSYDDALGCQAVMTAVISALSPVRGLATHNGCQGFHGLLRVCASGLWPLTACRWLPAAPPLMPACVISVRQPWHH